MNFAAQNVCGAKTLVRGHVEIIPWTEEKSNMLCKSIFKKTPHFMQIKNNTFNVLRSKLIKNFIKRKIGVWLNYNTHFKLFQHDSIENKVASSSLYGSKKVQ